MSASFVGVGGDGPGIEFQRPSFPGRAPAIPSPYDDVNLAKEVLQLMVARSWDCASMRRATLSGAGESDMAGREEERVWICSFIADDYIPGVRGARCGCDGQCSG